ncbi:Ig-like domain-containing protein [Candidatus Peregrinibacteria bacterium]|nr:Ig-like domain-containing protein [Candidatus Peregrinibacteria bacterium]MBI3816739.1 Ig-like domain-containing protein [Candidatus Peregrinibacteria bacterium]
MDKYPKRLALLMLLMLVPFSAVAVGAVQVADMLAGLGGDAVVTGMAPKTSLHLLVHTPGDQTIPVSFTTDANGAAQVHIGGNSVLRAGRYDVSIVNDALQERTRATFNVLPDRVDANASQITIDRLRIAADGRSEATTTVILRDRFGNAVPGRPVELVSSLAGARIQPIMGAETDAQGRESFAISSQQAGMITLRALDLLSDTQLTATVTLIAGNGPGAMGADTLPYNFEGMNAAPTQNPYATALGYSPNIPAYGAPSTVFRSYAQSPFAADVLTGNNGGNQGTGIIDHFVLQVSPQTLKTGEVANVTVTAINGAGQTGDSYTGTVNIFSPTDPNATVPGLTGTKGMGVFTFTPKNLGVKFLPLSIAFSEPGQQTLRVEDRTDPQHVIRGEVTVTVSGQTIIDEQHRIEVLFPTQNGSVNTGEFAVTGIGPRYANLQVRIVGGAQDVFDGTSDKDGHFSISVKLRTDAESGMLRVQDEAGKYQSRDVDFTFDITPPHLDAMTFAPAKPHEGETVQLTVLTEPKADVHMKLQNQDFGLVESVSTPGTYQVSFTSPAVGDQRQLDLQPDIIAKDAAGNVTDVRVPLTIVKKGLTKVENVTAIPRANAVELHWNSVPDAAAYRVYAGEDQMNLSAIETKTALTGAIVSGLRAGTTYQFAVTAVQGDRESEEKSDFVSATVLGLKLEVLEQEGALQLNWVLPDATPLSSFQLEVGTEPDQYTEKFLLNGSIQTYILHDLLNGVLYHVRLTPITTQGDVRSDLAATSQGTPQTNLAGFHPTPGENLTFDPNQFAPPDTLHAAAPATPSTGVPTVAWWIAAAVAVGLGVMQWQWRKKRRAQRFLEFMQSKYHS